MLVDVGVGEALEIPVVLSRLDDGELVDYATRHLPRNSRRVAPVSPGAAFNACGGYRVLLIMGDTDALSSLEISDLDVYWSLTGQLRLAAAGHEPGTRFRIDQPERSECRGW